MSVLLIAVLLAAPAEAPRPIPELLKTIQAPAGNVEERTRQRAVVELGSHDSPEALKIIQGLLADEKLGSAAGRALLQMQGPHVQPEVLKMLKQGSPHVRTVAASWLGHHGDGAGVDPLLKCIRAEADEDARGTEIKALITLALRTGKEEHVRSYLTLIDNPKTHKQAAWWAYLIREPRYAPLLYRFLDHPDARFREDMIRRVGRIKSPRSVAPLMEVVKRDKSHAHRRVAVEGLSLSAGSEKAVEVARFLFPLLEDDKLSSAAAAGLARLKHPGVGPVLMPALSSDKVKVRRSVAKTIGELGYGPAADTLMELARNDPERSVRSVALKSLGKVASSEEHVQVITALLGDRKTQYEATGALKELRNPKVAPALFPLLKHEDQTVRRITCEVLGNLAEPSAAVPLMDAVERDEDRGVKAMAAAALALSADPSALPRMLRLIKKDEGPTGALRKSYVAIDRTQRFRSLLKLIDEDKALARSLVLAVLSDPHPSDEPLFQRVAVEKDKMFRRDGLMGLGSMPTDSARDTLCRAMKSDPDPLNRIEASEQLDGFKDQQAATCLVEELEKVDKRRHPNLQEGILRSLRAISGQRLDENPASWRAWLKSGMGLGGGVASLVDALSHEDASVRLLAARELRKHKKDLAPSIPAVAAALGQEKRSDVRVAMIELLGAAGDKRGVDALLAALDAQPRDLSERIALARALDDLGDGRGTLVFVEQLDSDDAKDRTEAVQALSLITGEPPHGQVEKWKAWWKTYGERYRR